MSQAYVCDRDGCDTFQRVERARAGWLTVCEMGTSRDDDDPWHFCSADCLLLFFGQRPAGEEVPGR